MKCGFLFFATTFAQCEELLKFPLLLQSHGQQSKQASFETGTPITLLQKDLGNLFSATESKNLFSTVGQSDTSLTTSSFLCMLTVSSMGDL